MGGGGGVCLFCNHFYIFWLIGGEAGGYSVLYLLSKQIGRKCKAGIALMSKLIINAEMLHLVLSFESVSAEGDPRFPLMPEV